MIKNNKISKEDIENSGIKNFAQAIFYLKKRGYEFHFNWETGDYIVDKMPDAVIEAKAEESEINSVETSMASTILKHLVKFGHINAFEAVEKYNCLNLAHHICNLRMKGYDIVLDRSKSYKKYNPKVDRIRSCCDYVLIPAKVEEPVNDTEEPVDDLEEMREINICSSRHFFDNPVVVIHGFYKDIEQAETEMNVKAKEMVDSLNKSTFKGKNVSYISENLNGNIVIYKQTKTLFKTKTEEYLHFYLDIKN